MAQVVAREPEDQSRARNFALFTRKIKKKVLSPVNNQHSVILLTIILAYLTMKNVLTLFIFVHLVVVPVI